jgi:hypothetical protein
MSALTSSLDLIHPGSSESRSDHAAGVSRLAQPAAGQFLSSPTRVAVLCASKNSIYNAIPGVVVYDQDRDAFSFPGGMPVVAHPPCRAWSAYTRHQAKPTPTEKELGLWCAVTLLQCGGVLEQPAHSHLFEEAGLPKPGHRCGTLFTIAVWQAWWGYPTRKATWLCFNLVDIDTIRPPLLLHPDGGDRRAFQLMSRQQRSATSPDFARWLVDIAKTATSSTRGSYRRR